MTNLADAPVLPIVDNDYATLELVYNGEQGTVNQPVRYDTPDAEILRIAAEAISSGEVRGITQQAATLQDYKVDRFPAKEDRGALLSARPKTPFGG
jgi:hypothetical protein